MRPVDELAAMPRCHGVVRRGVGYDNVDVDVHELHVSTGRTRETQPIVGTG